MAYLGHLAHCNHDQITIPDDIDIVIHSGDATNHRDPIRNEPEMHKFLTWFTALPIQHKIFVAGNHDTSIERGLVRSEYIEECGIHYLYNSDITIEGLKIWGSPFTPTFGNWAFMMNRAKINRVWQLIPDDADIVVTHGPPKGILDSTYSRDNLVELCGCSALRKRIQNVEPQLMCFGHIHNLKDLTNAGTKRVAGFKTIFSNGSCCKDRKMGVITNHGNIIELPCGKVGER